MGNGYSTIELLKFLDYLGEKGLMSKANATSRKAACNNMLSILDDEESSDLRNIDLDAVSVRFNNLKGAKYTPKSLQVYKSRVSMSLQDFLKYKENPANFTVGAKPRQRAKANEKNTQVPSTGYNQKLEETGQQPDASAQTNTMNIPIAIRNDCIIQMNGIPTDLTKSEAQKIANVIVAMAVIEG